MMPLVDLKLEFDDRNVRDGVRDKPVAADKRVPHASRICLGCP